MLEQINNAMISRFWNKVKVGNPNECWDWTGKIMSQAGYGVFSISHTKTVRAHRFSYLLHNGNLPENLYICHKCDRRCCVNPNHLFAGTQADNMRDMRSKKRGAFGVRCGSTKLTESDVIEIRNLFSEGLSMRKIAKKYGIDHQNVSCICRRKTWKHL